MENLVIWSSIVFFLTSILMFIVAPEFLYFNFTLFILSIILILIKYKKKMKSKIVQNMITVLMTLLIVAISNYIVFKNTNEYDLTKSKIHTLSDKSKKVLEEVKSKLELTIFAKRQNWKSYLKLLELYKSASKKVSIVAIDPVKDPMKAAQYNIKNENSLLIIYENKKSILTKINELNLTNEILKFVSYTNRKLCFTQGHGEFDFNDKGNDGLSFLNQRIIESGFSLKEIDLLKDSSFKNCTAILSLGVKRDFLRLETKRLSNFLSEGGGFIATLAPNFNEAKRSLFRKFLNEIDIDFTNSVIIDRLASVHRVDATINVIDNFLRHPIVEGFKERIYMPISMVIKSNGVSKALYQAASFPATWGETDLKALMKGKASYDKKDIKDNLTSAVVVEKSSFRAAIFGSERFIVNAYQGQSSNFNFFLNTLDWIIRDEGLISLDRPKLKNEKLNLSAPALNTIFYGIIIFVPFVFFVIAGVIYRRNQKL